MFNIKCPLCNAPMIERHGKNGNFYGCTNYFKTGCKGSVSSGKAYYIDKENQEKNKQIKQDILEKPVKEIIDSVYQKEIYDFMINRTENVLVQAVAGSGKSHTLTRIVKLLDRTKRIIFLAFNVKIVKALEGKIPDYAMLKTFHGLGFSNIRKVYPKIRVEENKLYNLLKVYKDKNPEIIDDLKPSQFIIMDLVNKIKDSLLDCSMESISYLCDKHNIILNSDTQLILNAVTFLFNESIKDFTQIDYSDMIYYCSAGLIPCQKFDYILVDESQDLNPGQFKLIELSSDNNTRLVFVGDRKQSIYFFRGASIDSMDKIKTRFNCVELPLSICYRCPESGIRWINQKFPEIKFEGKPDNIEGIWESLNNPEIFYKNVKDGALVLCRNNAPLIRPAYKLLSDNRKVIIYGKEIGIGLISLIQKISGKYKSLTLSDFLENVTDYQNKESEKLVRLNQLRKLEALTDSIECIVNFAEGQDTIEGIIKKIDEIFSDNDSEGIIFSSIHKAKGLEAKIVYLLNPSLMPSKNAKSDEELSQEYNLIYVAYTRHMEEFYEVNLPK